MKHWQNIEVNQVTGGDLISAACNRNIKFNLVSGNAVTEIDCPKCAALLHTEQVRYNYKSLGISIG